MVHREQLERYPGTLDELAGEVSDLRYDALAAFFQALAAKLTTDAVADQARGRPRLAAALRGGASAIATAAAHIEKAWAISSPHM